MPRRHRTRHGVFRAFITLCLVTIILGIGYDAAHTLFIIGAVIGGIVGYVIGRNHEHAVNNRLYRTGRQYQMKRNDPVRTITILPHTDPPEPGEPPAQSQPRPYAEPSGNPADGWDDPLPYYGGKWSPERGYEPHEPVSAYPPETIRPCAPDHCNMSTACVAPDCYGRRPTLDQIRRARILRDPRSGAHGMGSE